MKKKFPKFQKRLQLRFFWNMIARAPVAAHRIHCFLRFLWCFFFLLLFALIWFFCLECRNGDWRLLIRQFKARINVRIKAEVGASELHKHLRVLDSIFTRSAYGLKANWRRLKLTRLGIDLTSWKKLSVRVSFFEGSPVRIAVWFLTQKLMSSRDARTSTNDSFVRFTCYVWILVVVVFVFSLLLLR